MSRMACTVEQAKTINNLIANGRTMISACKETLVTVNEFQYLRRMNGAVQSEYVQAREDQREVTEDEILDIADNQDIDPHRQRNMMDARYKILAARDPSRWGAKIDLQVTNKGDARQAEQKADARLMRYLPQAHLGQVIDMLPQLVPTLADKQSAGADDIFE